MIDEDIAPKIGIKLVGNFAIACHPKGHKILSAGYGRDILLNVSEAVNRTKTSGVKCAVNATVAGIIDNACDPSIVRVARLRPGREIAGLKSAVAYQSSPRWNCGYQERQGGGASNRNQSSCVRYTLFQAINYSVSFITIRYYGPG